MRGARQKERNYQNDNAYEENFGESLIQPYHQEWASQLANENNYRDDYDGEHSARSFTDSKFQSRGNSDRDHKSRHNDRRQESRNRSYDKSPDSLSRKSDRVYSPDLRNEDRDERIENRDRKSKKHSRRHSRSRSRDKKRHSRSRSRSRSRRSSRSRNRDRYREDDRSSYSDRCSTYREEPTNTIMLRGLAQHITQDDIVLAVEECALETKQIRLIRKKYTGASRGFAFVEFNTIQDAQRWMDMKQGSVMFQDQYRALMQYAVPRDAPDNADEDHPENSFYPPRFLSDWNCSKCGAVNFKRRENCFKCLTSRQQSCLGAEGADEISDVATKKIILSNLDILTKEDDLRGELESRTPGLIPLIQRLSISRDKDTCLSRGVAYLHFNNEDDSKIAYDTLNNCEPAFTVANKKVVISYCVEPPGTGKRFKGSHKAVPKPATGTSFTVADVPKMAEYSAELYAQNAEQKQQYLMYYTNYYMAQIAEGISISMPQTQSDETNSAAAVAHQAIVKMQNKNRLNTALDQVHTMGTSQIQVPSGTDGKVYAIPDISSYYYDQTSGYYYDVITGLYYDPNTQYYFNNQINKFLYWDNTQRTYVLAPDGTETQTTDQTTNNVSSAEQQISANSTQQSNSTDSKQNKTDKVKVAKRIAKDMERWAKTLNQKKENSKRVVEAPIVDRTSAKSATADICFSMVEKSERNQLKYDNPLNKYSMSNNVTESPLEAREIKQDVVETRNDSVSIEQGSIDFDKLACLICKRQFASREMLVKHTKMSLLHKQNLAILTMQT